MKNKELIKELSKYNPDADVTLTTSEDIRVSYICGVDGQEFDEETTPLLFIEGIDDEL